MKQSKSQMPRCKCGAHPETINGNEFKCSNPECENSKYLFSAKDWKEEAAEDE